jgi:hypothetical protein
MTISKSNNLAFDQGQGSISTKNPNETANHSLIAVGCMNDTQTYE